MVDSSKFDGPSGHVVCHLEEIDIVICDAGISPAHISMLKKGGVKVLIA
jgi:DeoR family ulaG and ulaABCDEF operon transcriptional repressor